MISPKNPINTLEAALIMDLETLFCAEEKLKGKLPTICGVIQSTAIRNLYQYYVETSSDKMLKIERMLSYLNHEPKSCSISVMNEMVNEIFRHVGFSSQTSVQDQLLISCLQRINNYKISLYKGCLEYAAELELDEVIEFLSTILNWEYEIQASLSKLSVSQLNFCAANLES